MSISYMYIVAEKTRQTRLHVRMFPQNAIELALHWSSVSNKKYEVIEFEVDAKLGTLFLAMELLSGVPTRYPSRYVGDAYHGRWTPAPEATVI